MINVDTSQISLKEGQAGLAKVGDSGAQLEGQVAGGETQMVSSNKSKRGSSLARLPGDVLYFMLNSFLRIKDVGRLDSAWTVRSERENCWLLVLRQAVGAVASIHFEQGKYFACKRFGA